MDSEGVTVSTKFEQAEIITTKECGETKYKQGQSSSLK
jgi:hypothetical protein